MQQISCRINRIPKAGKWTKDQSVGQTHLWWFLSCFMIHAAILFTESPCMMGTVIEMYSPLMVLSCFMIRAALLFTESPCIMGTVTKYSPLMVLSCFMICVAILFTAMHYGYSDREVLTFDSSILLHDSCCYSVHWVALHYGYSDREVTAMWLRVY